MIEIWTKHHLVSDSNSINPPPHTLQGMANDVGLTFSVGNTTPRVTISIEQDN